MRLVVEIKKENVDIRRIENGLNYSELAEKLGIKRTWLSLVLHNKRPASSKLQNRMIEVLGGTRKSFFKIKRRRKARKELL